MRSALGSLSAVVLCCALLVVAGAAAEEGYAGAEACATCHEAHLQDWPKTIHAKVLGETNGLTPLMKHGCESCHGPGAAHVAEGGGKGVGGLRAFRAEGPEAISSENAACMNCHSKGDRLHWSGSAHESRDVACTSCHVVHKELSERHQLARATVTEVCASCHLIQRAQMFRNAHMPVREGAMDCTSCHNPHGTVSESLMRHDSVNDTCYSCHADKRGPFLWEHPPVSENCLNCHDPHGSTRRVMLKGDPPRLCQQCHVATRHPSSPRDEEDPRFVTSRSCVQCHANIHGSNHPSGFRFMR